MADLESRVNAAVHDDRGGNRISPPPPSASFGRDEDGPIQDWGFIFGVAYAIARGEDPYESSDDVGKRARAVALPIYAKYVGDLPEMAGAA